MEKAMQLYANMTVKVLELEAIIERLEKEKREAEKALKDTVRTDDLRKLFNPPYSDNMYLKVETEKALIRWYKEVAPFPDLQEINNGS